MAIHLKLRKDFCPAVGKKTHVVVCMYEVETSLYN